MSERIRLLREYRPLWAASPAIWKADYPLLYQRLQQEARHPLFSQGRLSVTPFQDELPWFPRLLRQLAPEWPRLTDLATAAVPLLAATPPIVIEWGQLLPTPPAHFQCLTVSIQPPPANENRQWIRADAFSDEALQPLRGRRQLLALGIGLAEAQALLLKGCERRLPLMVLGITGYHLIDTSLYSPLQLSLPAIPMNTLKLLSMTQQEAASNWPERLLRWLFRPAIRQMIFDDLSAYAQLEGYQAQVQPLPAINGRQQHALVLMAKEGQ